MKNMQNCLDCEKGIQKVGKGFVFEGPLYVRWQGSPVARPGLSALRRRPQPVIYKT